MAVTGSSEFMNNVSIHFVASAHTFMHVALAFAIVGMAAVILAIYLILFAIAEEKENQRRDIAEAVNRSQRWDLEERLRRHIAKNSNRGTEKGNPK